MAYTNGKAWQLFPYKALIVYVVTYLLSPFTPPGPIYTIPASYCGRMSLGESHQPQSVPAGSLLIGCGGGGLGFKS